METLSAKLMQECFNALDEYLKSSVTLIVGGGTAMILAHGFPLATADVDGVAKGISVTELDVLVKKIAIEKNISPDWLNSYFSTFAHVLPEDYGDRLVEVFREKKLTVKALSKEEMLIMKCFAHRQKDVAHAKALIKKGANLTFVEKHIERLLKEGTPGAQEALDFLDDCRDQLGV